ncbi:MAG: hypothetical protein WC725_04315 [Patescibacteria group bacterium]|jgi:hypothetical protein
MSDQDEIKILVKKSDGSFIHMPISEVQKHNRLTPTASSAEPVLSKPAAFNPAAPFASVQPVAPAAPQKPAAPVAPQKPIEKPVEKKPETMPVVKPVEKNEASKPKFNPKENARLEKEIPAVIKAAPVVKNTPPVASAPIKNISAAVPPIPVTPPQSKPVVPKIEPVNLSVVSEKNDMGSLLDEKLPNENKLTPLTSESRDKQVDEIIKSIGFKIPPGNNSRVKTIIQLFLKEVRGKEETMEILRRPEIDGGVGLSDEQVNEVLEKCSKTTVSAAGSFSVPSLKTVPKITVPMPNKLAAIQITRITNSQVSTNDNKRLEAELPAVVIKTAAPKLPPKPIATGDARKILEEQITKNTMSELPGNFTINSDRNKTTMSDVKSAPAQMGPIEEIRYFSLVDFRRLSGDPTEAANRLKQKFLNLHEESVVFYFEGLDAWKISPLYHDYINLVSEAIKKRQTLAQVAVDKSRIQVSEISALIKMEKELG